MEIAGFTLDDAQAKQIGFVVLGVVAAVFVVALGRRTRRMVLGLVVTAALVAGLLFAFRSGAISDPWGILDRVS